MALDSWKTKPAEPEANDLLCQAHGCPNRWAVDTGSRLCSDHAWSESHKWPQITEAQFHKRRPLVNTAHGAPMTQAQKVATLTAMRDMMKNTLDPKAWAHTLRSRENAGEELTRTQREAWRTALKRDV
jgi:hypothetical protein